MAAPSKSLLSNLSYICVSALTFLMPVFFLTWTGDLYDFNKQYLLYFLVLLGLVTLALRAALEKKFDLVRTPLDIPLLILLVVTLIASLLSGDRYISFWGELSNLTYGFVPLLFYVLFYFLAVNVLQTERQVKTNIFLVSLSTLLGLLYFAVKYVAVKAGSSFFGASFPLWNPISNQNSLFGLMLSVAVVFALGNLMSKKEDKWRYPFWLPLLVLSLAAHFAIGFRSTWVMLSLGLVLLLIFSISRLDEMKVGWVSATFAVMVVAILLAFLGTPRLLTASLPTEVALAHTASWSITRDTLTSNFKHFLFGSGPATFVTNFSHERGEDFNNTIAWNVRFLHPVSNFLELLSTTGILGIIAVVITLLVALGSLFGRWLKLPLFKAKKGLVDGLKEVATPGRDSGYLYFVVVTGWLLLAISMFLTVFGTVHWWLFFFLLALIFSLPFEVSGVRVRKLSLKTSPEYSLVSSFVTILVFIGVIVLGAYLGRFYAAEVLVQKGRATGSPDKAISLYASSVNLNKGRYQYHLRLAESFISRASEELGKGANANAALINDLVGQAVNEARVGTDISPKSVMAWEFLATMYNNARLLTGEAVRFEIGALEKSIELEPTNPVLRQNLGNAKLTAGNVAEARDQYKEAVRLKPNYIPGYIALSLLEEGGGNVATAIEYMAAAASIAPNDPVNIYNLGRLYYNRNQGDDLARAEQLFLLAAALNPNYADTLWSLGLLYERRRNDPEALKYYRKVQALNPGNADVKTKVQSLLGPPPDEEKKK